MRNALAISIALCICSGLIGCNSNSTPPKPPAPPVDTAPATPTGWELKLQSKCPESIPADKCVGGYGFDIVTDGHYQLGPGPQGEVRTGTLTSEELTVLSAALNTVIASPRSETVGNFSMDASESDDALSLTQGSGPVETLITTSGSNFSYHTRTVEEAKALYSAIRNLAMKYYAVPFPDACGDGATSLQTLYSSMQSCTADSDCSYLDETFEAVSANTGSYITTDDCSLVRPLAVGNTNSVKASHDKLLELLEQVRNACGERMIRADCTGLAGFQLTGSPAICKQNVCQANIPH